MGCNPGWTYLPASGELISEATYVRLEPMVARVFDALIARNGNVVSRATLLDEVWGDRIVVDASVTRCIGALRAALHDEAPHRYIETLPKRGYRFVADVRDCTGLPRCDPSSGSCWSIMEGVSTRRRPDGVIR